MSLFSQHSLMVASGITSMPSSVKTNSMLWSKQLRTIQFWQVGLAFVAGETSWTIVESCENVEWLWNHARSGMAQGVSGSSAALGVESKLLSTANKAFDESAGCLFFPTAALPHLFSILEPSNFIFLDFPFFMSSMSSVLSCLHTFVQAILSAWNANPPHTSLYLPGLLLFLSQGPASSTSSVKSLPGWIWLSSSGF